MHRPLSSLLVLCLLWLVLPGGFELIENAYHLGVHGDIAHAEEGDSSHGPFQPEHGCGGGIHICSCCHSQLSIFEPRFTVAVAEPLDFPMLSPGRRARTQDFSRRLDQPPRV